MIYHVVPINDLKEHCEDYEQCICGCQPKAELLENGDILYIHNSYDGREFVEQLFDELNGKPQKIH